MKQAVAAVLAVLTFCVLAAFAMIVIGCSAQQTADFQKNEQAVVDHARAAVDAAQAQVDLAQKAVDAYELQLAKLPADAPERKTLDKSLTQAQSVLTRAQLYLSLAEIGLDVFATPPAPVSPPATQPAQ